MEIFFELAISCNVLTKNILKWRDVASNAISNVCLIFQIFWLILNDKNYRIFRGASSSMDHLMSYVILQVATGASCSSKFDSIKVNEILHNWEISLLCGP